MKKVFLIPAACFAFAAAAVAGPLNSKGIPAEAKGIIHLDFDAGSKSLVVKTIKEESKKNVTGDSAGKKSYEDFKKAIGFDPEKDITDVTLGTLPNPAADEPLMVAVIRGKFSPEKIIAAAKAKSVATVTYGKHTLINANAMQSAYFPAKDSSFEDDALICPLDKNTILVSNKSVAEKAIDAATGKTKSYAAPAALTAYGKQVASPIALGYVSGDLDKSDAQSMPMQLPKWKNIYFALADDTKNIQLRFTSEYADAAGAAQTQSMVQMLLGFAQMGASQTTGPDGQPDPVKVENAKRITKLISSLRITAEDKNLNVNFNYPTAEVITYVKEQAAQLTGQ